MIHKGFDGLIIDVNGVGYRVEVPLSVLGRLPSADTEVSLFIHTYVREDAIRLFGFESPEELQLFERLISVGGVGPRTAIAALSQMSADVLSHAIIRCDVSTLKTISGVGKKTAERIILELAERLSKLEPTSVGGVVSPKNPRRRVIQDLEDALRYLGYRDKEIQRVVGELQIGDDEDGEVESLLRRALALIK